MSGLPSRMTIVFSEWAASAKEVRVKLVELGCRESRLHLCREVGMGVGDELTNALYSLMYRGSRSSSPYDAL